MAPLAISFYIFVLLFCFGRGKGLNLYLLFVILLRGQKAGNPSLVSSVKIWRSHRRGRVRFPESGKVILPSDRDREIQALIYL